MKVTIASGVKTNQGRSDSGKEFNERYQDAYLHEAGKQYPTSCKVMLYDNARPFAEGDYDTKQDVEINQYGKLRVKTELVLAPVAASKAA